MIAPPTPAARQAVQEILRRFDVPPERDALADRCRSVRSIIEDALADGYRGHTKLHSRAEYDPTTPPALHVHPADHDLERRYSLVPELVFELINAPHVRGAEQRARMLIDRGARRVVGVILDSDELREWSPTQQAWLALDPEHPFDDPAFAHPVPIATLLHPTRAEQQEAERRTMERSIQRDVDEWVKQEAALDFRKGWVKRWNEACIGVIDALCTELGIAVKDSQRSKIDELLAMELVELFVDVLHCGRLSPSLTPWTEEELRERPHLRW